VELKIKNCTLQDCYAQPSKISALYVNGSYDQNYYVESLLLLSTSSTGSALTSKIVVFDFINLPSKSSITNNATFRAKFVNQCHRMNDSNFRLGEHALNDLVCPCITEIPCDNFTNSSLLLRGYSDPLYGQTCTCSGTSTCGTYADFFMNCVWVDEHEALICRTPQQTCEDIFDGETCKLPGMAYDGNGIVGCLWVEGNSSAEPVVVGKCVVNV
jgi:hypothetical protein